MTEEKEELSLFEETKARAREEYKDMPVPRLAELMQEWAARKEVAEEELKVINAHYDILRFESLPNRMDEEGIEKIDLDGIGSVRLTGDMFLQVTNKEALYDWLESHKFGSLIQPTVNSSTLKAMVKGRMKEGKDLPSDCLKITPITRASITKSTKK